MSDCQHHARTAFPATTAAVVLAAKVWPRTALSFQVCPIFDMAELASLSLPNQYLGPNPSLPVRGVFGVIYRHSRGWLSFVSAMLLARRRLMWAVQHRQTCHEPEAVRGVKRLQFLAGSLPFSAEAEAATLFWGGAELRGTGWRILHGVKRVAASSSSTISFQRFRASMASSMSCLRGLTD